MRCQTYVHGRRLNQLWPAVDQPPQPWCESAAMSLPLHAFAICQLCHSCHLCHLQAGKYSTIPSGKRRLASPREDLAPTCVVRGSRFYGRVRQGLYQPGSQAG